MIDLYTSRRDHFLKCVWFSQDTNEDFVPISSVVHEENPSGSFFAKELNPYTVSNHVIGGSFYVNRNSVQIMTYDNVENLKKNDLVKFNNHVWRVEEKQTSYINKQKQFSSNPSKVTILSLQR